MQCLNPKSAASFFYRQRFQGKGITMKQKQRIITGVAAMLLVQGVQ